MFSTDFIFRQPEMSGWIRATMQQNTNFTFNQIGLGHSVPAQGGA